MPAQLEQSRLSVRQFAERFRGEMIPLSTTISYFCASTPLTEEDMKEYLEEPVAALPLSISQVLPKISILLVPYLERGHAHVKKAETAHQKSGEETAGDFVSIERPPQGRQFASTHLKLGEETVLVFALKEQEVAEYHYRFYHLLASLMGERCSAEQMELYCRGLREEMNVDVHGEVDEPSWRLKQGLKRGRGAKDSKAFRQYARNSFIDTLTLYLHGICCDIDVDMGPRQLPSRYLRKRLVVLQEMFPPPNGYAIFPEQLEP